MILLLFWIDSSKYLKSHGHVVLKFRTHWGSNQSSVWWELSFPWQPGRRISWNWKVSWVPPMKTTNNKQNECNDETKLVSGKWIWFLVLVIYLPSGPRPRIGSSPSRTRLLVAISRQPRQHLFVRWEGIVALFVYPSSHLQSFVDSSVHVQFIYSMV